MTLAAGSRVGFYEVISAFGGEGMGEVYRARDTRLQRDVALKILLKAISSRHVAAQGRRCMQTQDLHSPT